MILLFSFAFLFNQLSASALYIHSAKSKSLRAQENLNSITLPLFRYDRNNIELNQKTSIDLILNKNTNVVKVEIIGAEGVGLGIDNSTLIKKGIKILNPAYLRANSSFENNKLKLKTNKPVIFNLNIF